MKKTFFFLAIILIPFLSEARSLWAFMSYSTFNSPEGPYIETYLTVAGNSVKYVRTLDGKFQATVNILMTFKQNNQIKAFKKYELNSPEISDTNAVNYEFLDEQRFQLPNGTYDFELQISDKNKSAEPVPFTQSVVVDFPADKPVFSGIQLVKSYIKSDTEKIVTKSGYDLIPYIYNFYPGNESKMIFYAELYNMDKVITAGEKYILRYFIESFETNITMTAFARTKKEISKPVGVILSEFNIESLATGNYNLVFEARNGQNEVVATKKIFFQRSNPHGQLSFTDLITENSSNTFANKITSKDSLKEFISSTYPISSGIEKAYIKDVLKTASITDMQNYFYGFWLRRNEVDPQQAWLAYKEQVKIADFNFKTPVKKGYQTDRGRVFLEYGPPNTRSERPSEPSTYPYEIWHYYSMKNNQTNRKFVFYSPDMVTNDYFLLHSDAQGEIHNYSWQVDLQSRMYAPVDISDTQTINSWGDMAKDYWELPN
jgi:GWxTD domain-containing protein